MSRHNPEVVIRQMIDLANEAAQHCAGCSLQELRDNRLLSLSVVRLVEMIGEAATRIPPETRDKNPHINWDSIIAMRNRLIHGYDMVDYEIVWKTVTEDLPELIAGLQKMAL